MRQLRSSFIYNVLTVILSMPNKFCLLSLSSGKVFITTANEVFITHSHNYQLVVIFGELH